MTTSIFLRLWSLAPFIMMLCLGSILEISFIKAVKMQNYLISLLITDFLPIVFVIMSLLISQPLAGQYSLP